MKLRLLLGDLELHKTVCKKVSVQRTTLGQEIFLYKYIPPVYSTTTMTSFIFKDSKVE